MERTLKVTTSTALWRTSIALLVFLATSISSFSQIVSMSERKYNDGWQGDFMLGLNLVQNTVKTVQSASKIDVKYSHGLNSYGISTNFAYSKVDEARNINEGSFGFIYNYKVPDRIVIAEGFAQMSYNTLQKLNSRILAGGGPRFKIRETEGFECTLVAYTVYMSERYSNDSGMDNLTRSFRFSSMFTLNMKISENTKLTHNTYYEPNFSNSKDYRIWSETALNIKIMERFSFNTAFKLNYKSISPVGVDNLNYSIVNTLQYSF